MNGQRLKGQSINGWGGAGFGRRTDLALFDSLPPEIRKAVACAIMPLAAGEVLDEWATARRRGMTAGDFAALIPQEKTRPR